MVLRLVSVSRQFGAQRALDDVSIHVRRGDCYAFLGHNGAGKTTAMRVALGLDPGFRGRVLIDGFDIREFPREARTRLGGLIEVPGFHGSLDGARNLIFLARLQGMSRADARREAGRLLELVGLAHAGPKPVTAYSHGMRQRLGIAQALIGSPQCVLLDEPTNGLDPQGIADMRALLTRLTRDEGMTVMLSSHQLAQLAGLVNRVGVLHQGRLLVEAETEALLGGATGRFRLELESAAGAAAIDALERLGVRALGSPGDALRIELAGRPPSVVLRELVATGAPVRAFAPEPPTLEEIYLEYAQRANDKPRTAAGGDAPATAVEARTPAEHRAPKNPIARVLRYELERAWSRGGLAYLLALPAVIAAVSVLRARSQALELAGEVQQGQLFSTTDVTAFQTAGQALQAALPLCTAIAVGLSTQSIAGEYGRGTLRNLLLRPVLRAQAALGKFLAQLAFAWGAYALVAVVALAVSAWAFDFRGVAEILPDGQRYELARASDLLPELRRALTVPLLPLFAYSALGFLAGAVARTAAGALAFGLGLFAFLDLVRTIARGLRMEGWLPSAYLPSPLGDTSFLAFYADVAQGVSNANFAFADTALAVPLTWGALAFGLAVLVLSRRSVP
jgi:ABC-2 type transport system ATP-binding protein